jgi:hypothetical protein
MEENLLFTRIHDALDVPIPPGAYERLRAELTKRPVRASRWPALEARWEKTGFKLAASLAIISIVAAAAAALAIQSAGHNSSSAGSGMSIAAYKKMVGDDYNAVISTYSSPYAQPCEVGVHSACVAGSIRGLPTLQKWIDDLSGPEIPARFAVVNAEMRQHLLQTVAAQHDVIAAGQANDGPAMDRAIIVAVYGGQWTNTVVPGITSSIKVDGPRYVSVVTSAKKYFETCISTCTLLVSAQAASCTTNGGVPCVQLFDEIGVVYATLSTTLVQYAAPDSLATEDTRLQTDLAAADSVLRTMRVAVADNDQAGINSGVVQLLQLNARIDRDASSITGG